MKRTKFTLLALSAVLSLAACSKKSDDTPTTPTTTTPAVIGSWNFVGFTVDTSFGKGMPEVDLWSSITPCTADNYWTFKTGDAWEQNEGTTKCNPSDAQTITDTWKLDGTTLTISPSAATPLVMTVTRLDADTMKLNFTTTMSHGTGTESTKATYIMKRKS